jgi:hypothetical protein
MPAGNSAFVKKREAGVRRAPSFGICLKWGAPDLFEIASGTNRMRTGFGRGQLLAQALVLAFKVPYSIREHFRRIVPRLHGVRGALLRRFFEPRSIATALTFWRAVIGELNRASCPGVMSRRISCRICLRCGGSLNHRTAPKDSLAGWVVVV